MTRRHPPMLATDTRGDSSTRDRGWRHDAATRRRNGERRQQVRRPRSSRTTAPAAQCAANCSASPTRHEIGDDADIAERDGATTRADTRQPQPTSTCEIPSEYVLVRQAEGTVRLPATCTERTRDLRRRATRGHRAGARSDRATASRATRHSARRNDLRWRTDRRGLRRAARSRGRTRGVLVSRRRSVDSANRPT